MFIPIGDEPKIRQTPVITYALIAINVVVFLLISLPQASRSVDIRDPALPAYLSWLSNQVPHLSPQHLLSQISAYDLFTFNYGFKPADPSLSSLFFSLFLHGGWLHLLGNMLFLWIYGNNVEARVGPVRYLAIYLGTGIAASLFFAMWQRDSLVPLIGASGAISGILGCYFWWFPQNKIRVLFIFIWFIDVWRIPARWVLGAYIIVDNVLPFLMSGPNASGVAHGAHIGGFFAGLGIAAIAERYTRPTRSAHTKPLSPSEVIDTNAMLSNVEHFSRALRTHDIVNASSYYAQFDQHARQQIPASQILTLAAELRHRDQSETALGVLQQFIAQKLDSPLLPQAHIQAGLVHLQHTGRLEAARQHFLAVLDIGTDVMASRQAREGLTIIDELRRDRLS